MVRVALKVSCPNDDPKVVNVVKVVVEKHLRAQQRIVVLEQSLGKRIGWWLLAVEPSGPDPRRCYFVSYVLKVERYMQYV